jgi:hypothetical protein
MRHLLVVVLCTIGAACGIGSPAVAQTSSPLEFSLDLLAPCSGGTCSGIHPTDAGLQVQAGSFAYTAGSDSHGAYGLATLGVSAPLACDEVAQSGSGAIGSTRLAPEFSNAALSGGVLDFNAGGDTIVDLTNLSYDGSSPAGVASSYNNYANPQVTCYSINPINGGPANYAAGPYGIFNGGFEGHISGEPWVSVQTVNSPNATGGSSSNGPSAPTLANTMAYVVQVHNAASATNWRLSLGYDHQYFSSAASGAAPWACVLGSAIPQPGSMGGTCTNVSLPYKLQAADVQSATNSIYIYVSNTGSNAASTNWSALGTGFYPATAALFPPFGTYPQRNDDKAAVASGNNPATLNIGNIVCNNNKTSTSCMLYGPDGNAVPSQVTFHNSINSAGLVNVDPLVYYVSPYSGSTLPSTVDTLNTASVSNVSCSDPNGILASPLAGGSFVTSTGATGALQVAFTFKPNGSVYFGGTANCTARVASPNHAPALSATVSFAITMLPTVATHFSVTAPSSATAGSAFNSLVVTALDSANNTVGTYNGTVHFSSNDGLAVLPANVILSGGTGTFSATLKTAGGQTISVTDAVTTAITGTSGTIAVAPAAASRFSVIAQSYNVTQRSPFAVTVYAYDPYNNIATGYAGTVHITSSDTSATLPANSTLTNGSGNFNVTLNTTGTQTVIATDTVTSSITGTSGNFTVAPAPPS